MMRFSIVFVVISRYTVTGRRLADAMGAIGCLRFDGRVPPGIDVNHVVGAGELQPEATGAQAWSTSSAYSPFTPSRLRSM